MIHSLTRDCSFAISLLLLIQMTIVDGQVSPTIGTIIEHFDVLHVVKIGFELILPRAFKNRKYMKLNLL